MKILKLLHHFVTVTYATLTTDDDVREMWRLVVPRIAFSYEFVMHALLAMSALHLNFLGSPDNAYSLAAAGHYGKALFSLGTALPAQDSHHADALYAASLLTAMYGYAFPQTVESILPEAASFLPNSPKWIPLFKGTWTAVEWCWDWVRQGELAPLFVHGKADQSRYVGEDIQFQSSLFDLSKLGAPKERCEDDYVRGIYRIATEELKRSWDQVWSIGPREAAAFWWVATMSGEFFRFLEELRPKALVLLAHHCALMELLDDQFWWINGRGAKEIERIDLALGEEWKCWLDWPKMRCNPMEGDYAR